MYDKNQKSLYDKSLKVIEDVEHLLKIIESQNDEFVKTNGKNAILQKINFIIEKSKLLENIEYTLNDETSELLANINTSIHDLERVRSTIIESISDSEKPKLWIYGCSMSHNHGYDTHDNTWYTLLSQKLDYDLEIRSDMAYGINAIQRTIVSDLRKIDRAKDLVIFSPSFWHRVYVEEFEQKYRAYLPTAREWDWYKYLTNMNEIMEENFERWITTCEILLHLNINFRTWLLDPPIAADYPYESGKRISKFHHLILKPPISPQILGWMPLQKQKPEFWFSTKKGKEDHHWNEEGHQFIATQFYNQIKNIRAAI